MRKIFVTGIGTDVGKTVVSSVLVEALKADYWDTNKLANYLYALLHYDGLRKEFLKMEKSGGENSLSQTDLTVHGADGVVSVPKGGGRAAAR